MHRHLSLAVVLAGLTACGVDAPAPEAPAGEGAADLTVASPRKQRTEHTFAMPLGDVVHAQGLSAADGTRVKWVLGVMGCGIFTFGGGEAEVRSGAFVMPFDAAQAAGFGEATVFVHLDVDGDGACTPEVDRVVQAPATLPGTADLSQAEESFAGCWLFDEPAP